MQSFSIANSEVPIEVGAFMHLRNIKDACAVTINGVRISNNYIVETPCDLNFYNFSDEIGEIAHREATANLLAVAVKKLYPNAKLAGGGNGRNGFYYDFDIEKPFTPEDLSKIEKEMQKLAKSNVSINEICENPISVFTSETECYFVEMIKDTANIFIYECAGVRLLTQFPIIIKSTKLKNFKLMSSSAAYWKGDEKNKMLQRISGVSFDKKDALMNFLNLQEELGKRNNKKIGKELELFFFDDTAPGMPYWLPKGQKMYNTLVQFWRDEHEMRGYQEFSAPLLNDSQLWKISGHWEHYRKDMFVFTDEDGTQKALKPMSCPNAIKIYQTKTRSYRDLPLRFNDVDVIHRNEKSGELNGMLRVRMFRQDDSHNFIRQDQIASEIKEILDIANKFYGVFGLTYKVSLSTRPESFIGDIEVWDYAERELTTVLNDIFGENNYGIKDKDGAFYGPKIDIQMKDALGREWQMGTIQLDFQLPKRFEITYIDENGHAQTPIILHRVIYGSLERFIGIITEHFAGAFPLWFSPIQVEIATIGDEKHERYAKEIAKELVLNKIRIETNFKRESIGHKIRYAQMQKIPYTIIIGDNEVENNNLSIRSRKYGDIGSMTLEQFIEKINEEVKTYSRDN